MDRLSRIRARKYEPALRGRAASVHSPRGNTATNDQEEEELCRSALLDLPAVRSNATA
jgi:hypothetical protein